MSEAPTVVAGDAAPIADRRHVPRLRSLLSGILIFDESGSTMDCAVRNISAYGARVMLADAFRLPDAFRLRIPHHDQTHQARIVWRKGDSVGLALSDVEEPDDREGGRMTARALKRTRQGERAAI